MAKLGLPGCRIQDQAEESWRAVIITLGSKAVSQLSVTIVGLFFHFASPRILFLPIGPKAVLQSEGL